MSEEFLGAPINIGTLPAGKSVTIQWDATIDPQQNQLIVNPSNQGTVTGTQGAAFTVNTNTVVTTLDTLTLGSHVFRDLNGNGTFDAGEGVSGVALTLLADSNGNNQFDAGVDLVVATTTTGADGVYSFTGLAPGNYILQANESNFNAGGPLRTCFLSPGTPTPTAMSTTTTMARG